MMPRPVDDRAELGRVAPARQRAHRLVDQRRLAIQIALDATAWVSGLLLAQYARYDFTSARLRDAGLWFVAMLAVELQLLVGALFQLYRGRYRFGSFEEVRGVVLSVVLTMAGVLSIGVLPQHPRPVPAGVPLIGGTAALVLLCGVRYAWRLGLERQRRPRTDTAEPLLVFGAGEGGYRIISSMLADPDSPWVPVALLDDDPHKRQLQLCGVRVRGGRDAIPAAAERFGVRTLLVAVPTADADLLREITALAEPAGLAVKVLPPVGDLIHGQLGVGDIRDIDVVDLLGRRPVETDVGAIAGYLTGRRVLVTGAGGSIGSELCRQISRFRPAELIMLDRDESALHSVQLSIEGRALLDSPDTVLADIRDIEHVNALFAEHRPQVVFHAAALKHLPLLEQYPGESLKTNVWGSLAVLEAASAVGVLRFVNISTDKAANPVSVLGYSKRITERLTSYVGDRASGTFVSVRFGNVLGSRGSVLTTFSAQIAGGGPVTVTHPDVSRYFMTIPEAVQLVIQAGALGRRGDALVLDMGEPVGIADVARRLVAQSGTPVDIVYTGLRPGEKLHEELFGDGEPDIRPRHPLISHVSVPMLDPVFVLGVDAWDDRDQIRSTLRFFARCEDLDENAQWPLPSQGDDRYRRRATDLPPGRNDSTAAPRPAAAPGAPGRDTAVSPEPGGQEQRW